MPSKYLKILYNSSSNKIIDVSDIHTNFSECVEGKDLVIISLPQYKSVDVFPSFNMSFYKLNDDKTDLVFIPSENVLTRNRTLIETVNRHIKIKTLETSYESITNSKLDSLPQFHSIIYPECLTYKISGVATPLIKAYGGEDINIFVNDIIDNTNVVSISIIKLRNILDEGISLLNKCQSDDDFIKQFHKINKLLLGA